MPITRWGSSYSTFYPSDKSSPAIFNPKGEAYHRWVNETIALTSDGASSTTLSKWGLTDITMAGNTTNATLGLGAPHLGCEKIIVLRSTVASTDFVAIDVDPSAAGIRIDGSSDGRYVRFSSLATSYQSVTLIGLSTAIWTVKCVNSTVGGFNAAGGIRTATAASSN